VVEMTFALQSDLKSEEFEDAARQLLDSLREPSCSKGFS
jgi:hypothetical protein